MQRSGLAPFVLVGLGAFMLGAMMFGGAATAGAASAAGAAVMWPFFAMFKLVFFFLLFGFIARMFWGRGWDRRHHHGSGGRRDWDGPWAPPWAEGPRRRDRDDESDALGQDPRAWFEQRVEDWHLKAHARMDIDRLVPDPTKDDETDADDRDVV